MKKSIFECGIIIRRNKWKEVLSASLGAVLVRQKRCHKYVVGDNNWSVDFSAGILAFGTEEYLLQFIGSESISSNTWLWGWKNINSFKDDILTISNEMKEFGEKSGLDELYMANIPCTNEINGHTLSIVTCALSKEEICYYRGPHKGGAVFMAFAGVPKSVFDPITAKEFVDVTTKSIAQYDIDHPIFVTSVLAQNGIPYTWINNTITAHFENEIVVELEKIGKLFDRETKIKSIVGQV